MDAVARARSLRHRQTATERVLWDFLRDRRLADLKFRRQVPLGPYVADFACLRRRLIVESDGPFHDAEKDALRDAWLASQGFRILRFPLTVSKDEIAAAILNAIEAPPSPLAGEGVRRTPDG